MQKPISHLIALCASLQAACLSNQQDENASANELVALPRARLAAIANAIDSLVLDGRHQYRVLSFHMEAQKAAHELLARFDGCSERALGAPVSRAHAIALISEVVTTATGIAQAVTKLDGACSEMHEMFR